MFQQFYFISYLDSYPNILTNAGIVPSSVDGLIYQLVLQKQYFDLTEKVGHFPQWLSPFLLGPIFINMTMLENTIHKFMKL